jgi:hypothetical protein
MGEDQATIQERRNLLRWGARLALGLPALLAGLQVASATAHADDGDDDNRGPGRGRGRGRGRGEFEIEDEDNERREVRVNGATFSADLVPINQVNTGDFNPGGSDSGFGTLVVGAAGNSSSVIVRLRGATPNATYNVQFVPLNNAGARQQLGSFSTNSAGNGSVDLSGALGQSGSAPGSLGTRVGSFLLTRSDNNQAAFVTAA